MNHYQSQYGIMVVAFPVDQAVRSYTMEGILLKAEMLYSSTHILNSPVDSSSQSTYLVLKTWAKGGVKKAWRFKNP